MNQTSPTAQTSAEPLVSVVIPAHNAAATIHETVSSVLQQTFANLEVLVIDNASTDATAAVVAGIDDGRVRCISFAQAGASFARNQGIGHARGRYVALLDADDLWLPDKIAEQLDAFENNPEAGLVFCWCDSVDEHGVFLKKGNYVQLEEPVYEQMIQWNLLENTSSPMIRREVLEKIGAFDEKLWLPEDWDLWLRIAYHYPIICIPKVLVHYRVHRGSASLSDVQLMIDASLKVLGTALDRLPPSRQRDKLERISKANLYQHLAMRMVETSDGRSTAIEAAGLWWRSVRIRPGMFANCKRSTKLGMAILAILILPPATFTKLRRRWSQRQRA